MIAARFLFPISILTAMPASAQLLVAQGNWAAFARGDRCEAMARSELLARKSEAQAYVTVTFDRAHKRVGELMVALRRPVRVDSSVIVTIGEQPFLLVARGDRAWTSGPAQDVAVLASLRSAGGMRVEARDSGGRRMIDRYLLAGAPTAIDAAAAECSRRR